MAVISKTFELDAKAKKFIADYKDTYPSIAAIKTRVVADGEEEGEISEELHAQLQNTHKLFCSYEYAEERKKGSLESLSEECKKIVAELKKDPHLSEEASEILETLTCEVTLEAFSRYTTDNSAGVYVDLESDGDDHRLDISHLWCPNSNEIGDFSWDWLALLADENSPYYDEDFKNAYIYDQLTIAVDELYSCNAKEIHEEIKEGIVKFVKELS